MKLHYLIAIAIFILCLFGGACWSAWYYSDKASREKVRADSAEQQAESANIVTANVIQAVNIINAISEANQDAKNQIALESQRAQADIKVAVADDDCARQPVPAAAADRLRQFADSLRTGSGSTASGKPDS
ncbi:TPA: DUF2570 domain-containing protein [Escherichia coli]|uniref:DUF2570 domain-containing protein n=1 Tax=Escherichia coli TaxID=562 RepID=UPI001B243D9D|nr:DUF2570 domain-containing protein [Escherichia coli]EGV0672216.1 DUF2570 domain-containing protein [Escherichia coli]MDM8881626.1 DUF2570 domain-containing protein [Escherichia coli]MDM8907739.1 DUF2570 domain-containing protein [Escherichia coli]WNU64686.1 DUF2570 domain-containing protein [Escherichia coli]HAV8134745.1 DUF2570 domain-containing protein [Escherichia coli]